MKKQILLTEQDYLMISSLIKNKNGFSEACSRKLQNELRSAKILSAYELPNDVVKINSTVKVVEINGNKPLTFQLVTPSMANIKEGRVAYTAPLAAALIGYRKGDTVNWTLPSGEKSFQIVDVIN
ncbi:MAG TPA: GreA/GreB family elongation factor [Cytophagaceae bacterium]